MSQFKKQIDLAKKLKALAEQGVGGEKENAVRKLIALMRKHGITEEELEQNTLIQKRFRIAKANRQIFFQVVSNVIGKRINELDFDCRGRIIYNLNQHEFLEITAKFEFYKKELERQTKIMYSAFVMKHHIYPCEKIDDNDEYMTPEEEEKYMLANEMAQSMKSNPFRKMLN